MAPGDDLVGIKDSNGGENELRQGMLTSKGLVSSGNS